MRNRFLRNLGKTKKRNNINFWIGPTWPVITSLVTKLPVSRVPSIRFSWIVYERCYCFQEYDALINFDKICVYKKINNLWNNALWLVLREDSKKYMDLIGSYRLINKNNRISFPKNNLAILISNRSYLKVTLNLTRNMKESFFQSTQKQAVNLKKSLSIKIYKWIFIKFFE